MNGGGITIRLNRQVVVDRISDVVFILGGFHNCDIIMGVFTMAVEFLNI